MSATAGALGIQVEKEGHYRLGESRVSLSTDTIVQATQILWVSAAVWSAFALVIVGVISVVTS
jgi:cobalamin biosynthesis protein CobD/CbiB